VLKPDDEARALKTRFTPPDKSLLPATQYASPPLEAAPCAGAPSGKERPHEVSIAPLSVTRANTRGTEATGDSATPRGLLLSAPAGAP